MADDVEENGGGGRRVAKYGTIPNKDLHINKTCVCMTNLCYLIKRQICIKTSKWLTYRESIFK